MNIYNLHCVGILNMALLQRYMLHIIALADESSQRLGVWFAQPLINHYVFFDINIDMNDINTIILIPY